VRERGVERKKWNKRKQRTKEAKEAIVQASLILDETVDELLREVLKQASFDIGIEELARKQEKEEVQKREKEGDEQLEQNRITTDEVKPVIIATDSNKPGFELPPFIPREFEGVPEIEIETQEQAERRREREEAEREREEEERGEHPHLPEEEEEEEEEEEYILPISEYKQSLVDVGEKYVLTLFTNTINMIQKAEDYWDTNITPNLSYISKLKMDKFINSSTIKEFENLMDKTFKSGLNKKIIHVVAPHMDKIYDKLDDVATSLFNTINRDIKTYSSGMFISGGYLPVRSPYGSHMVHSERKYLM